MSSRIYFMLVAIFTVAGVFQFSGAVSGAQHCGMNTNVLGQHVSQCEKYVLKSGPKIRPSPGCCAVVKKQLELRKIRYLINAGKIDSYDLITMKTLKDAGAIWKHIEDGVRKIDWSS
ncbi:hypothetical protein WN943_009779 [Citrus x changshan-huyou]